LLDIFGAGIGDRGNDTLAVGGLIQERSSAHFAPNNCRVHRELRRIFSRMPKHQAPEDGHKGTDGSTGPEPVKVVTSQPMIPPARSSTVPNPIITNLR
jgi:hypothetical protein